MYYLCEEASAEGRKKEGMITIIIILGVYYILEINPIYSIIYFIGMVISIAIMMYKEGIIYISLILIIVYSTALIILFGFVMMKGKKQYPWTSIITKWSIGPINILIILPIVLISIYLYYKEPSAPELYPIIWKHTDLITTIGNLLYNEPIYIVQILLSAILLLFPIFSLLFLS